MFSTLWQLWNKQRSNAAWPSRRTARGKVPTWQVRSSVALEALEDRNMLSVSPVGPEFVIENKGNDGFVAMAMDTNGDSVVAWWRTENSPSSGTNVYARLYDPAGNPRGAEFRVNTTLDPTQGVVPSDPAVAMDAHGNFVVAWENFDRDGDGFGVVAQRFNAAGATQGVEFQVNSLNNFMGDQRHPAAAMDAAGNFQIVWAQEDFDPSIGHGLVPIGAIYGQSYNSAGQLLGGNTLISDHIDRLGKQAAANNPEIARDAGGDTVVVWEGRDRGAGPGIPLDESFGIYARRFSATGASGGEFIVNTTIDGLQDHPRVAMDPGGDTVIVWNSQDLNVQFFRFFGQRYDAQGSAQGGQFHVADIGGSVISAFPELAVDGVGNFIVAWNGDAGILAQTYDNAGNAQGGAVQVNNPADEPSGGVAVGAGASGQFSAVWTGSLSGTPAIFGQRLQSAEGGGGGIGTNILVTGVDVGGGPNVRVFSATTGTLIASFFAFDPAFTGGVRVAIGDINGDGTPDIICAAGPGAGPAVKVFDGKTLQPLAGPLGSFFAYNPILTSGMFLAVGDVNRDGFADIITSPDAGGSSNIKVFSGKDGSLLQSFFAYDPVFTGGTRVAAGDVNGDGFADIIVGAGPGGGPNVKVFSGRDSSVLLSFFAYSSVFTGGVFVAAGRIDSSPNARIIVGADAGGGPNVKVFNGLDATLLSSFFAYDSAFTGGVRVGAGDVTGSGQAAILTGAGPGAGPHVKAFDAQSLVVLDSFFAYDPVFNGGLFVAGR